MSLVNSTAGIFSRFSLTRAGMFLGLLFVPVFQLQALIITTNCPDTAVSLPQPKRIQSGCPAFGPLGYYGVLPQFSTAGFYHIFGNNPAGVPTAFGLGQSDPNGLFAWKVDCANGSIAPLNTQGRVLALQDLPAGFTNVTCLGVYDRSGGTFVPVFEKRLPINNRTFVGQAVLNNGTFVLSINRSNSVMLLGVNSSGTLLWAKQLASADFPFVSDAGNAAGHTVTVSEMGTNNVLLAVSGTEYVGATNTAKTVLVRLDASGVIQWSKKFQVPLVDSGPSSFGSQVFLTPGGEVLAMTSDYDLQVTTLVNFTHLTKVATDGTLAWSRRFVGGSNARGPQTVNAQGSLLLELISSDASGGHSVCCLLNAGGQVTSLVQIDPPAAGLIRPQAVSIPAGKIYFAGNAANTPVIGSSSLDLSNFTAKAYIKGPLISPSLALLEDSRLAFFGTETNYTNSHLVLLTSNLAEQSGCGLFAPSTLSTSASSITAETNTLTISDIAVTTSNLTLSLVATQLQFQVMAFQEQALCTTNCDYFLSPGGVALGLNGGSTNVNVAVASLSPCSWTVTNPCASWITVSLVNGSGSGQTTLSVSTNSGSSRSCTLTIAGLPFTVTQAGDIRLLAAAVEAPELVWTTGGNTEWSGQTLVTHDGVDAGQSGIVSDNQESWMETSVQGPGTLTFWWKVSSQGGSDRLRFNINGVQQASINGEVDWRGVTNSLAAGTNILRWRYTKDSAGSGGQDRGWVDQVVWTPTATCTYSLSTSNVSVGPGGGSNSVNVTVVTGSNCGWIVLNPCTSWLTVLPTNGTGNGQVTIVASGNSTGAARACTLTVAGSSVAVAQAGVSSGDLLVQYDPTGAHASSTPLPSSLVASNVTASTLQEVGLETTWNNTDALPVGRITTSSTVDLSQYLTFTVQSAASRPITFKSLWYDKQSYLGAGPTHASVRSSLDSFAADIVVVTVNPAGFQSLNFDLSTLSVTSAPVTFRIYFYGAPSFTDFADLVGAGKAGNGLRVTGTVSGGAPMILVNAASFGFTGGKFGFNVNGPAGRSVVVEWSTNLQGWSPLQTNAFGSGPLYFSDPQSGFSGARFYRARLQ